MAKTMAVDIETYSAADLTEVGVHRYVEDPTFEVLLIAYSVDDGPVIVIDEKTLSNEDLERRIEFFNLLVDPAVTKYAYNAAFERSCLAKWAEEPMPRGIPPPKKKQVTQLLFWDQQHLHMA